MYGAPEELKIALMGLAKETKGKGWWHAYGDVIPESFDLFIGLEEAASSLELYSPELVPGLFQTSDYARAVIKNNSRLQEEEIDRRVQLRIQRQTLVTRFTEPTILRAVLNEAVIRRGRGRDDGHGSSARLAGGTERTPQRLDPSRALLTGGASGA
ncbi:hypothetical protein BJY14_004748 [Actinomadura luteofluorescens]|uniref:DUF5753 domain-containing protein n=1 Tax=Actinomadura luteofluorescens TaxID=46163 RepID=A0A7Y9EJ59_9ACTN|nr:Scr1 family TA system antitoxin-like transcriptional regulator [Actinomadura luteofluorescens]NYD48765.1 hypothetical protein [Actinomadura luteofluorescens]